MWEQLAAATLQLCGYRQGMQLGAQGACCLQSLLASWFD
jgi:hypothetical protein